MAQWGPAKPYSRTLKPRIDRLALKRQHPENAFVDAAQRFTRDETLERLMAEGELPDGEVALAGEAAS